MVKTVNFMLCEFYHNFKSARGGREGGDGEKNEEKIGHKAGGMGSSQRFFSKL